MSDGWIRLDGLVILYRCDTKSIAPEGANNYILRLCFLSLVIIILLRRSSTFIFISFSLKMREHIENEYVTIIEEQIKVISIYQDLKILSSYPTWFRLLCLSHFFSPWLNFDLGRVPKTFLRNPSVKGVPPPPSPPVYRFFPPKKFTDWGTPFPPLLTDVEKRNFSF